MGGGGSEVLVRSKLNHQKYNCYRTARLKSEDNIGIGLVYLPLVSLRSAT